MLEKQSPVIFLVIYQMEGDKFAYPASYTWTEKNDNSN